MLTRDRMCASQSGAASPTKLVKGKKRKADEMDEGGGSQDPKDHKWSYYVHYIDWDRR